MAADVLVVRKIGEKIGKALYGYGICCAAQAAGQAAAKGRHEADDLREVQAAMSQVTKRALEQSLKNLLLKKPLTKITINDIAEDCGINRMTFYYHFKDIYDLVEGLASKTPKKRWMKKRPTKHGSRAFCRYLRLCRRTDRLF